LDPTRCVKSNIFRQRGILSFGDEESYLSATKTCVI
jgi:hypothetical protein